MRPYIAATIHDVLANCETNMITNMPITCHNDISFGNKPTHMGTQIFIDREKTHHQVCEFFLDREKTDS
jgi:hypothetical protein